MILKLSGAGEFSIEANKIVCKEGFTVLEATDSVLSLKSAFQGDHQKLMHMHGVTYQSRYFNGHLLMLPSIPGITVTVSLSEGAEVKPTSRPFDFKRVTCIDISGSVDLLVNAQPPETLNIIISGSGCINSLGKSKKTTACKNLDISCRDSGAVRLDWVVDTLFINLYDSGTARKIHVKKSVTTKVFGHGSGTIFTSKDSEVQNDFFGKGSIKIVPI